MDKKWFLFVLILLFSNLVGAQSILVNETSEWDHPDAVFSDTETSGDELFLNKTGLDKDWENDIGGTFLSMKKKGNFLYTINDQKDSLYKIRKTDGAIDETNGMDIGFRDSLAWGPGKDFLYVNSNDTVRKVFPSNLTEVNSGNWPYTGFSDDINDIATHENGYLVGGSNLANEMKKIDLSDATEQNSYSRNGILAVEVLENEEIAAIYFTEVKVYSSDFSTELHSYPLDSPGASQISSLLEEGPDGNLYTTSYAEDGTDADNWIAKLDQDLNQIWKNQNIDNETAGLYVDKDGKAYAAVAYDADHLQVFDSEGRRLFTENLFESPRAVLGLDNGAVIVLEGVVERFKDSYASQGQYYSETYYVSSSSFWQNAQADTDLNSQSGVITANLRDTATGSPKRSVTSSISDGTTSLDLGGTEADYVDFNMTLDGGGSATPEVFWVEMSYSDSPLNTVPEIRDPRPPDGSDQSGDKWEVVNATVEDSNNDNTNVSIFDRNGDLLNNTNLTSGGPRKIKVNYSDLKTGWNDWTVEAFDGSATTSEVFSFYVKGDPPSITDPEPADDGIVYFSPVDLSIDVDDPDGEQLEVNISDGDGDVLKEEDIVSTPGSVSTFYSGLTKGNSYQWQVNVSDGEHHVNRSYNFSLQDLSTEKIRSGFVTNYTSIFASTSNQELIPYTVSTDAGSRTVNISLLENTGLDVTFADNSRFKEVTVDETGRTFLLKIDPADTGSEDIRVDLRDETLGVESRDTIEVHVRETPPRYQRNNIPGIGLMQLISLIMLGSLAYFASL